MHWGETGCVLKYRRQMIRPWLVWLYLGTKILYTMQRLDCLWIKARPVDQDTLWNRVNLAIPEQHSSSRWSRTGVTTTFEYGMFAARTMRSQSLSLPGLIWRHLQPLYVLFMQPTDFGVLDGHWKFMPETASCHTKFQYLQPGLEHIGIFKMEQIRT